jgi:3-oxoacyl-[acyl-carrier-protein] synthase II
MRRVVISGLGAISPHGLGAPAFWNALLESRSSISALTRFDPSAFSSQVAGTVPAYKATEYVPKSYRKATKIMARDIELAVVAADFAVRDGRLITKGIAEATPAEKLNGDPNKAWFKPDPARMGCNIGAGLISADLNELAGAMDCARTEEDTLDLARWGRSEDPNKTSGMDNLTPLWLLKYLPNMLACHVSIIHDTQGPSNTITCGQASAGLALAEAVRTIQRGEADLALVGGCESKVHPMGLMRWSLLKRLAGDSNENPAAACRPYDVTASGAVLAEGGAVLLIEEYEHAKKRGATIYAEVVGLGASASVSTSVVEPDHTGEAPGVAVKKALKDAGVKPEEVGLVVPPGYGISAWDKADVAALEMAFGKALEGIAVLPARAGIGDCGAGAQALDLVAAILALQQQVIPPAVNVTAPIANLRIPREKQTGVNLTHAVVLASALGGQNSAVVLKRYS